MIKDKEQVNND